MNRLVAPQCLQRNPRLELPSKPTSPTHLVFLRHPVEYTLTYCPVFQDQLTAYLLATTFVEHRINLDIETGGWRPLNMERPPFGFPAPLRAIDEKCLHTGGIYADKRLALWRLADIAA